MTLTLISINDPEIICLYRDTALEEDPAIWLGKADQAVSRPDAVLKSDGDKKTLKTHLSPWGEVCLHDTRWHGFRKSVSFFRKSPGRSAWELSSTFADMNIPVIEQVLFLEVKRKGFISRTIRASRWLEGCNLGQLARERNEWTENRLADILVKAVSSIARFHGAGFIHGDLKWSNLLYAAGRGPEVFLTDLDHVRKSRSPAARGRDLARFILAVAEFNMPEEVEEKLIGRYLEVCRERPDEMKKSLFRHLARKRKRYEKRGAIASNAPV